MNAGAPNGGSLDASRSSPRASLTTSQLGGIAALRLGVSACVLLAGFRAVSDDDYARVAIAETWAHSPHLDPSGTSWLPFPFWLDGAAMLLFGRSLLVAQIVALALGAASSCLVAIAALRLTNDRRAAVLAGCFATLIGWSAWLGVATVPELSTAALTLFAASTLASTSPRDRAFGALALLGATLSRYEPWPVALAFAAWNLVDLARGRLTPPASRKVEGARGEIERATPEVERPTSVRERTTSEVEGTTSEVEGTTSEVERAIAGVERSTSGGEKPTSGVERSTSQVEKPTAGVERSTFGVERSTFGIERSARGVKRSTSQVEKATAGGESKISGNGDRQGASEVKGATSRGKETVSGGKLTASSGDITASSGEMVAPNDEEAAFDAERAPTPGGEKATPHIQRGTTVGVARRLAIGGVSPLAVAGPLAWIAWNRAAHGEAFHFVARVTAYRKALGEGTDESILARLVAYPAALAREMPEVAVPFVLALLLAAVPSFRSTIALRLRRNAAPLALGAAQLVALAVALVKDGAPTHHPERATLFPALAMAVFVADVAAGLVLLRGARREQDSRQRESEERQSPLPEEDPPSDLHDPEAEEEEEDQGARQRPSHGGPSRARLWTAAMEPAATPPPRLSRTLSIVAGMALLARAVAIPVSARDAFVRRGSEIEMGEMVRAKARPGDRVLIEATDYGYFAVEAASGRPEIFELDRDLDPRHPAAPPHFDDPNEYERWLRARHIAFLISALPDTGPVQLRFERGLAFATARHLLSQVPDSD